jgi:hypothetical protein
MIRNQLIIHAFDNTRGDRTWQEPEKARKQLQNRNPNALLVSSPETDVPRNDAQPLKRIESEGDEWELFLSESVLSLVPLNSISKILNNSIPLHYEIFQDLVGS